MTPFKMSSVQLNSPYQIKKVFVIMFTLFFTLTSCEKIIDVKIPDTDRKIVINGLINPDSLVHINLSRSLDKL